MGDKLSVNFLDIWFDQARFNLNYRPLPTQWTERCAVTKEISLCMQMEISELMRAILWKPHRKELCQENRPRIVHELIDIFKYWVTLCQVWGLYPEDVRAAYATVSQVCEQRYYEEYQCPADRPLAVVDLDGVICDYARGLLTWLQIHYPGIAIPAPVQAVVESGNYMYVDATSLGCGELEWQTAKHTFRVSGGKRTLPPRTGAREFLSALRGMGYTVAILSSRPVDMYPNIRDDTVAWMIEHGLCYDMLWFTTRKHEELILRNVTSRVAWCLDDDAVYCRQYSKLNLPVFMLGTWDPAVHGGIPWTVQLVETFKEVLDYAAEYVGTHESRGSYGGTPKHRSTQGTQHDG